MITLAKMELIRWRRLEGLYCLFACVYFLRAQMTQISVKILPLEINGTTVTLMLVWFS